MSGSSSGCGRARGRGTRARRSAGRGSRSGRRCRAPRRASPRRPRCRRRSRSSARPGSRSTPCRSSTRVERAAGAAVGVGDEDALVAALRARSSFASTAPAIRSGVEWSFAGQAADVDVRPPVEADHGEHLAGDRAAREDEHVGAARPSPNATSVSSSSGRRLAHDRPLRPAPRRGARARAPVRSRTATAASRQ